MVLFIMCYLCFHVRYVFLKVSVIEAQRQFRVFKKKVILFKFSFYEPIENFGVSLHQK